MPLSANESDHKEIDAMDTTMTRVCVQMKRRECARVQWQVYRWIGVCAMLTIACLIMLSLVF